MSAASTADALLDDLAFQVALAEAVRDRLLEYAAAGLAPEPALQRVTGEVFRAVAGAVEDAGLPAEGAVALVEAIDRRLAEVEDDDCWRLR
jgi:hypothetical protein